MANTRDQELGLLHVHTEPFTVHSSLPHLGFGDTLQVISKEKLPWHTSAELAQKHFQHQDEGQWAKNRALMPPTPTPHSSPYWLWTRTWLPALKYIPWMDVCRDTSPLSVPREWSCPTAEVLSQSFPSSIWAIIPSRREPSVWEFEKKYWFDLIAQGEICLDTWTCPHIGPCILLEFKGFPTPKHVDTLLG